jgi:hypothetical protein
MLTPEALGHLVCPTCGRQLAVPEDEKPKSGGRKQVSQGGKDPYGHADDCTDKQPPVPAALLARGRAEILRLVVTLPEDTKPRDSPFLTWAASLGYSLSEGLQKLYMLDGPEIEFVLEGPWKASVKGKPYARASLTFIDPAVGGAGFLRRAAGEFHLVARRAIDHLDHSNCEDACYRCLKDYRNQRNHEYLSWPAAMPGLQALASEAPTIQSPQLGDSDDPEPWLEAYDAGVGSPLELRFLRLFAQHGLSVEKQVPVSPTIDGQPISAADFAIPDRRLAIYIDGAAYHRGANLRRDRAIRDRLRAGSPPWTVVELTAKDLGTWRPGDKGTWGQSDKGTWGLGIGGTWGWGEKQEINDRVH